MASISPLLEESYPKKLTISAPLAIDLSIHFLHKRILQEDPTAHCPVAHAHLKFTPISLKEKSSVEAQELDLVTNALKEVLKEYEEKKDLVKGALTCLLLFKLQKDPAYLSKALNLAPTEPLVKDLTPFLHLTKVDSSKSSNPTIALGPNSAKTIMPFILPKVDSFYPEWGRAFVLSDNHIASIKGDTLTIVDIKCQMTYVFADSKISTICEMVPLSEFESAVIGMADDSFYVHTLAWRTVNFSHSSDLIILNNRSPCVFTTLSHNCLAMGRVDGVVEEIDFKTKTVKPIPKDISEEITCLIHKNPYIVAGYKDGSVRVHENRLVSAQIHRHHTPVTFLALESNKLVVGNEDDMDIFMLKPLGRLSLLSFPKKVLDATFISKDILATTYENGVIKVWDILSNKCLLERKSKNHTGKTLKIKMLGGTLVTFDGEGLTIWSEFSRKFVDRF